MTASVVPTDEAGLRKALGFGCTHDYVDDVVGRLKKKHDSVKVIVKRDS